MAEENLKNLPAEERLKKLKELEKKKKQEIEEAQKQIKDSESEITEKKKWVDKVPIPEVAQENLEGLSAEGKQLLKTHKGTKEKMKEEDAPETTEKKKTEKKDKTVSNLEETILREKVTLPPEAMAMEYGAQNTPRPGFGSDYKPLSERSVTELYQEIGALHKGVESKGYISRSDERKAEYLSGIVQERQEAAKQGTYTFSEETARAASITLQVAHSIKEAYKKGSTFEHDWYKGR
ncbi:MAG: hypothetical protein Q7K45_02240 [Nanoarchaeota archaeon]|nr:hypothetical protein [Nanoarchaeota archaeon]